MQTVQVKNLTSLKGCLIWTAFGTLKPADWKSLNEATRVSLALQSLRKMGTTRSLLLNELNTLAITSALFFVLQRNFQLLDP